MGYLGKTNIGILDSDPEVDWTADQGATNIHSGNLPSTVVLDDEAGALHATDALRINGHTVSLYKGDGTSESVVIPDNNTTYSSSDFTHDDLTGFVANEHIDWTTDQGSTNIHLNNLPATALTTVQTAATQAAQLALTAEEGDVVVRSDENKTYMHNGGSAGTMADFTLLATPTDSVTSVDGATGVVTLNHDSLTGFVANEHIDWTTDQGSTNLHTGNYTNTTYLAGDGLQLSSGEFSVDGWEIGNAVNLSTLRETGIYSQTSNTEANAGTNYPVPYAGILEVVKSRSGSHTIQRYTKISTNDTYQRYYYNGSWTNWVIITADTNTQLALSDVVNSTSSTTAASSQAVKSAYDRAWAPVNHSHTAPTWSEVTSKPSTFAPSSHTHTNYITNDADDTMSGALTLYKSAASPTLLTLHNYQGDIAGAGNSQGNFIDFKMTDTNANYTPQARIGMVINDYSGDGGIPSEGTGNFVVYTSQGSGSVGAGSLNERFRVTEDGRLLSNVSQRVFADDYHPNADKWTTPRTLTLTGDVSGSVSWDGSGNTSMIATVANDSHTHSGYAASSHTHSYLPLTGGTLTGDLIVSKTSPSLKLHDTNSSTGTYPEIRFTTTNNQGVKFVHNEFDGELPIDGYGLVLTGDDDNTQFPSTGTLSLVVHGNIYSGGTSNSTGYKVLTTDDLGTGSTDAAAGNHTHSGYAASSHTHTAYLGKTAKAADSEKLDGLDSTKFTREIGTADAVVGAGWITVAKSNGGRHRGEVIVSDSESSDHAYIRIEWMRSYADSNFTVITCGGHANRITGARILQESADATYGWDLLQVYVTTSSRYRVQVFEPAAVSGWSGHTAVTPVVQNTISGYGVHGTQLTDLDSYSLASEEGILAGSNIKALGTVTASGGNSGNWNTAHGWGDHALAGYTDDQTAAEIRTKIASSPLTATHLAAGSVGASELNVSGNGTTTQYLRSDGDGSMSWVTPPDTVYTLPTTVSVNVLSANLHAANSGVDNGFTFWGTGETYSIKMGSTQANHGTVTDYSMHHNMGTTAGRGFTFGSSRTAVSASINALTGAAKFNDSVTSEKLIITPADGDFDEDGDTDISDLLMMVKGQGCQIHADGGVQTGIGFYKDGATGDGGVFLAAGNASDTGSSIVPTIHLTKQSGATIRTSLEITEGLIRGSWELDAANNDWVFYRTGTEKVRFASNGDLTASGNVTAYSDERLKDNIETITSPLDKVKALRGVTFDKDGERGLGVIAQETEAVIPEVVLTADDEMGTKSVAYGNMVGLLIEAIKEQQTQIDDLKLKLEELT